MPEDESINFSLVNLGKLSEPANTLIKKVSDAVGGLFAPRQITRVAKAEAEANLIKAKSDIQVTDLHRRAMHRFVEEEAKRQSNMESITSKTILQLDVNADPSQIEDDWITNFFDKCRIVSDDEMQKLWSKLLAGEANAPGKFSKRTVTFLSDLDERDATLFSNVCQFGLMIDSITPLVFCYEDNIYKDNGVAFNFLSHLDTIGLIQFDSLTGFKMAGLPQDIPVSYHGQALQLTLGKGTDNELPVGQVMLTAVGRELAPIIESKPIDGFMDYVKNNWQKYLPKNNAEQGPAVDADKPRP